MHFITEIKITDHIEARQFTTYCNHLAHSDIDRRLQTTVINKPTDPNFPTFNFLFLNSYTHYANSYSIFVSLRG